MHFFYLDETGDTGTDLGNSEQPIFVLGGVTVSDKSWRKTTDAVQSIITDFFNGAVPDRFELHAHELVAHQGPFASHSRRTAMPWPSSYSMSLRSSTGPIL
jgi:hypothetical protein